MYSRRLWSIPISISLLTISGLSHSAESSLNLQEELSSPGTRMVCLEFYATWCKPCMEAVPKWKALHEKYKNSGLKFIVVSAEGNNTCTKPPDWSPDEWLQMCKMKTT